MKKVFAFLMLMAVVITANAHDLIGFTADGDTLYFNNISNKIEGNVLEVTYKGGWYGAFEDEYQDTINIPSTINISGKTYVITVIGEQAFAECRKLTAITIPETIKQIKDKAFQSCCHLEVVNYNAIRCADLTLPQFAPFSFGNMAVGEYVYDEDGYPERFWSAYDLKELNIGEKVQRIPSFMFYGLGGGLQQADLTKRPYDIVNSKAGVEHINFLGEPTEFGDQCFRACRMLQEITLPKGITYYGQAMFTDCDTLSEVILPEGMEEIPAYFFKNCKELVNVELPNTITRISYEAFRNCAKLTEFELPDGLQVIGPSAFRSNANLLSITLPNSLVTIDGYAFSDCNSLQSITIPQNVIEIGNYAFEDCTHLTNVTFEGNTRLIGNFVFAGCLRMSNGVVNAPALMPQIQNNTFFGIENSMKVNVPTESLEQYINNPYWGRFFAPTEIENINGDSNYNKLYRDGQLLIQRNGSTYTISGQIIK